MISVFTTYSPSSLIYRPSLSLIILNAVVVSSAVVVVIFVIMNVVGNTSSYLRTQITSAHIVI